jgi:hypothetical protein
MREALFIVIQRPDGSLIGENIALRLAVSGIDRDDLHHEAREALISAVGPAHVSYRVRLLHANRLNRSTCAGCLSWAGCAGFVRIQSGIGVLNR